MRVWAILAFLVSSQGDPVRMQLLTVQCDDTDDLDRDYEYCALDANTITHQKLAQIAAQEWPSRWHERRR